MKYIVYSLALVLCTSCTMDTSQLATNVTQDPVVEAALNSREGRAAQLLIDSGNRFVECIDAYNAYLSAAGTPIPSDVVEQTRACTLSLEASKEQVQAEAEIHPVVLNKVYHPSCNHIPAKEELLRVEVDTEDMSTFAQWTTPEIVPTDEETTRLTEALPQTSCQAFIETLFSSAEDQSVIQ